MKWRKEWGPQVEKLQVIELETGRTPPALANAPVLSGLTLELVSAFDILSERRNNGVAQNPIQLSEIAAFVNLFGPPSVPISVFVHLIGVMDLASVAPKATNHGNESPS